MPGFADSFWSADYAGGLGVLFGKLQQGIMENEQILSIARMRADAEEQYGKRLADIPLTVDKMNGGFQKDDGASLKKAYEGVRTEMQEGAKNHLKIASNVIELVVVPFSRWCDSHEARVMGSHDDLQGRIKAHDRQAELVRKLRSTYFNKCRQLEDLEEEGKFAFQTPAKAEASPKGKGSTPTSAKALNEPEDGPEPVDIGDDTYNPQQLKSLLTDMLTNIPIGQTKVPLLGTYTNVSTGSDIVDFLQKKLGASSVSYAERMGQDVVSNGFLRLVGNVGSTFANSSRMYYQWRPKVFQITGIQEKKQLDRIGSFGSDVAESPVAAMGDMLQGYNLNPFNNPYPNETPPERMRREARDADEKYKLAVKKLDSLRCNLEEAMVDHLKFMERCEMDRMKALKSVMLDFSGSMGNVIPALQSAVDNMMLYQEAVQPQADMRYLMENYKTGTFFPKVTVYDNYYNNVDGQTFGVDLEARARADRKRVPMVVTSILTFLDSHYPDLDGDEARRSVWTVDVPLAATHHLRAQINNGELPSQDVLNQYEVPIVASVLKLYLLELPDSLVSSQVYEVVKTVYSSPESTGSDSARIAVLQNTLGQLRLANIATLDAITTHFTRLLELTSADDTYVASLGQSLAPCILRPRIENTLTMQERHGQRLIRDLFDHKEEIFGELKRASAAQAQAQPSRGRQAATPAIVAEQPSPDPRHETEKKEMKDESNRREKMEERAKEMMSRARAKSPAPLALESSNRHRRDRSVGDRHMRFPVVASPTVTRDGAAAHQARDHVHRKGRYSLEVPDSNASTPTQPSDPIAHAHSDSAGSASARAAERLAGRSLPQRSDTNGSVDLSSLGGGGPMLMDDSGREDSLEKKNSLNRAGRVSRKGPGSGSAHSISRSTVGSGSAANRESVTSIPESRTSDGDSHSQSRSSYRSSHGVQLEDRPMDF